MESLWLYAGVHSKHECLYRMLSKTLPYAIYYDIIDRTAIIVAVLDMRRNPDILNKKLSMRRQ